MSDTNIWTEAGDGNIDRVRAYLAAGTYTVNAQDDNGYFPLAAAVSYNHLELATFLLAQGADVHLRDHDGNSALHYCESVPLAEVLVKAGADVCAANGDGETPADVALEEGFVEVVGYLVSLGAPAPQPSAEGDDEDGERVDMDMADVGALRIQEGGEGEEEEEEDEADEGEVMDADASARKEAGAGGAASGGAGAAMR